MTDRPTAAPRVGYRLGMLALLGCLAFLALPGQALGAARWLSPTDLSTPGRDASNVDVAMDGAGNLVAVWQRAGSTSPTVEASVRPAGGAYSGPITLASPGTAPQVAITPSGDAIVVFGHFNGVNNLIQARIRPAGGSFSAPIDIASLAPGFSVSPEVAVNASGDAAVVWLDRQAEKRVVQVSTGSVGGGFAEPVDLSDPAHDASSPQVAVGPGGEASVVWQGQSGDNPNVIQFSSGEGASFSSAVDVSTADNAYQPKVAVDSAGDPTVVWSAVPETEPPDPEPLPSIVEASTRVGAGAFSPSVELSDSAQSAAEPRLAMTPTGEAAVVWLRTNGVDWIVQAATRPAGGAFAEPVDLSLPGASAERAEVAVNAAGTATVVWQRGAPTVVQASVRPPGGPFGAPLDISAPGQEAIFPRVAMDQAGDGVAVWLHLRGADNIAQASGYDANPPQVRGLAIPARGTVGIPVSFSADPFDVWPIATTSFDFGDGTSGVGRSITHAYSAPGSYPVIATVTDQAGSISSAGGIVEISPSYDFRIGKRRRNAKRGTATLTIVVPGPGLVSVSGKAVRKRAKRARAAGRVSMPIVAKGKALKQLAKKGKARVRAVVSFAPDGGDRSARRNVLVVLEKKR